MSGKTPWRWVLVLGATGVAIMAAPFVVGCFLPASFAGHAEIVLPDPPEKVWSETGDHAKRPLTGANCLKVEERDRVAGLPAWRENAGSTVFEVTTVEERAPSRRVYEIEDALLPMHMRWETTIAPEGEGSRVTVDTRGEVALTTFQVPLYRFALHVLGAENSQPRGYLAQWKAHNEEMRE